MQSGPGPDLVLISPSSNLSWRNLDAGHDVVGSATSRTFAGDTPCCPVVGGAAGHAVVGAAGCAIFGGVPGCAVVGWLMVMEGFCGWMGFCEIRV